MIRRPPRSTRTDTLFPYTTLFRSSEGDFFLCAENPAYPPLKLNDGEIVECWGVRSEEHTSELQSLMRISYAVFCLKKKKNKNLKHLLYKIYHCNSQAVYTITILATHTTILYDMMYH